MIAANEQVATLLESRGVPTLYRAVRGLGYRYRRPRHDLRHRQQHRHAHGVRQLAISGPEGLLDHVLAAAAPDDDPPRRKLLRTRVMIDRRDFLTDLARLAEALLPSADDAQAEAAAPLPRPLRVVDHQLRTVQAATRVLQPGEQGAGGVGDHPVARRTSGPAHGAGRRAIDRSEHALVIDHEEPRVDMATLEVTDRIATRADPDPVAVIA